MAEDQDEKTEQATDSRREDFRKRGQVAMTRELSTAALFMAAAGVLYVLARFFYANINEIFQVSFGITMLKYVQSGQLQDLFWFIGKKIVLLTSPVMFAAMIIGVATNVLQTGFLQIEDAFSFDLNKLNPLNSLSRIFSMKGLIELLKSLIKMTIVFVTLYFLLKSEFKQIPFLSNYSIEQQFAYIGKILFKLLLGSGIFMLAIAVADYFIQRWQLEKEMMMTKQEVKEEHKQREGDPHIKARIKKTQREISQRKMMQAIPKADVVITNPTHIACVLKYSENLPAPQLVAKGADFMAEKIKAIARENNIPILENKPLARTIFKTMKIGQVIPRDLFVAVAEVLSYVYRLKRKKANKQKSNMKSSKNQNSTSTRQQKSNLNNSNMNNSPMG